MDLIINCIKLKVEAGKEFWNDQLNIQDPNSATDYFVNIVNKEINNYIIEKIIIKILQNNIRRLILV